MNPLPKGIPTISVPQRQFAHYERMAAARIHHIIQTHYAGHPFEVTVSLMQFRAIINHPLLPDGMAIIVRLSDEDPDGKIYVRLCGELLERFNLPRGPVADIAGVKVTEDDQRKALADIK